MNSTNDETPEVSALLTALLDRDGELSARNAPKEWVEKARLLETRLRSALRAIEEAPHSVSCASRVHDPLHKGRFHKCDCWKSKALT